MNRIHPLTVALILAAGSLSAPLAMAMGHERGNGGGGMVCRRDGRLTVELLDFWEGEALKGLKIRRNENPIPDQIADAVKALNAAQPHEMSAFTNIDADDLYRRVEIQRIGFLPRGVGISPPADAINRYVQKGCNLEGIGLYDDDRDTLDIDFETYEPLSTTSRAGLFFHEGIYKYLRSKFHVEDSIVARNITACAFSEKPCNELNPLFGIPETGIQYSCQPAQWIEDLDIEDGSYLHSRPQFLVYPVNNDKDVLNKVREWRFQLVKIGGIAPPAVAYFDINMSAFLLSDDGVLQSNFTGSWRKSKRRTKSSNDRWKDIGFSFEYTFSRTAERAELNGHPLKCRRVR